MTQTSDVVIIGAGSAGYATALRAAQLGLSVTMVESDLVGGTCLHRGCIPTKAWLQAAKVRQSVVKAPSFGIAASGGDADATAVRSYADGVVGQLHKGLTGLVASRGITVVAGRGRLQVAGRDHGVEVDGVVHRGRAVVLATGAEPATLGLPVDGQRVITSEHALRLDSLPSSAVVVGGGVIGVEFASLWQDLGVAVTLVEATPSLLPSEEPDLVTVLTRSLKTKGVDVRLSTPVAGVEVSDDGVTVALGEGTVSADLVLVAVGRRPVTAGLGLEEAGVALEGAHIAVDADLMTSVRGVYAAGDLVAGPQLAHRGYAHGMFLAERIAHVLGKHPSRPTLPRDSDIARITYSSPQVASVGLTSAQAGELGEVKVADHHLRGNGRSLILRGAGQREGGFVRIVRRAGGEIVGVHAVGDDVAELISEGALLVAWHATPEDLRGVVHPHPTLSEALAEANLVLAGAALHTHA